ncbi:MAG: hypothetical protein AAFR83_24985, partial [Cyanobacteria bacterium J06629_18]
WGETSWGCRFPSPKLANPEGVGFRPPNFTKTDFGFWVLRKVEPLRSWGLPLPVLYEKPMS